MLLAQRYAQHALAPFSLEPDRSAWVRSLLYDFLAVTLGGTSRESAKSARAAYDALGSPDGISTVFGSAKRLGAEDAALINGITAHGLELDDTFEEASLHPGVVIFPAVLAVAEERNLNIGTVLDAAVVGYDVMCNVGLALGAAESYRRGFHPTGVAGAIGAAAALSRILHFDKTQAANAIGIAANLAAGSLEFLSDGAWTKRLNAGHAAAVGVRATRLAGVGFLAPETALEGRDGFLANYGEGFKAESVQPLQAGEYAWNTSIKLYPCCRYMHGNLDLLLDIAAERPGLTNSDIAEVEVAVIRAGARLVSLPAAAKLHVESVVDAQFNMPFGAALALTTGEATVEQFDRAAQLAPDLMPLIRKVRCVTSPAVEAAFPADWTAEVKVTFSDDTVLSSRTEAFRGSPDARASRADLLAKATTLLGQSHATQLWDTVKSPRDALVRDLLSTLIPAILNVI